LTSYAVEEQVDRAYDIIVRGDINKDAEIDITDLVQLSQHMAKVRLLAGVPLLAADISGDGKVDITDLVRVSQYMAKVREID
jgi:hypothetical protein